MEEAPFDRLLKYKATQKDLLRRNQLHVLKIAQAYRGLAEGPEFEEQLAAIRVAAQDEQQKLQDEAHDSWWNAEIGLAKKAVTALASGGAAAGIAVLRTNSFHDIVLLAAPVVATVLGVAVSSGLDVLAKERQLRSNYLAYMLDARTFLAHRHNSVSASSAH